MLQFGNDLIDSLIHSNVKFNSIFPSGFFRPYTQGCQSTSTTNTPTATSASIKSSTTITCSSETTTTTATTTTATANDTAANTAAQVCLRCHQ